MARVLTLNLEDGAQTYDLARAVAVVRAGRADIAVLPEARTEAGASVAPAVAAALGAGWAHVTLPNNAAVVSRWPLAVVDAAAGLVRVTPPAIHSAPQSKLLIAAIHFTDYPYQPFQAAGLPYCWGRRGACQRPLTAPHALAAAAARARGP